MSVVLNKVFAQTAYRLQKELPEASKIQLFLFRQSERDFQLVWPSQDSTSMSMATAEILTSCFKRQRSILVHDSKVDPLVGKLENTPFNSALCCPLLSQDQEILGAIWAEHLLTGAFAKEHRLQVERIARKLSEEKSLWKRAFRVEIPVERPNESDPKIWLALFILAVVLCLFWFLAPKTPGEKRAEGHFPPSKSLPKKLNAADTAANFWGLMQQERFDQAWLLLSSKWQQTEQVKQFEKRCQAWMGEGSNRWDFQHRKLGSPTPKLDTVSFSLEPDSDSTTTEPWQIQLIQENEQWKILEISGTPLRQDADRN